jgi:hypothetical protein
MTACAIRYRLDGPGPAAFLVDCDGELRVYARGALGGVMPTSRLLALLAERGCRWVPASGAVELDLGEPPAATQPTPPHTPEMPLVGAMGLGEAAAAGL